MKGGKTRRIFIILLSGTIHQNSQTRSLRWQYYERDASIVK
jgi:hypothetical protein